MRGHNARRLWCPNRCPALTSNERSRSKKNSSSMGGVGCDGRCDERGWSKGAVIDGRGGVSEEEGLKERAGTRGTQVRQGAIGAPGWLINWGPFTVLAGRLCQPLPVTSQTATSGLPVCMEYRPWGVPPLPVEVRNEGVSEWITRTLHSMPRCIASRAFTTVGNTHRCDHIPTTVPPQQVRLLVRQYENSQFPLQ